MNQGSARKKIILKTDYDPKLEKKILEILISGELDSYTMLELSKALGKEYQQGTPGWEKLRLHLIDMVRRGLIEERHFGPEAGDWNRVVDYNTENKGIRLYHRAQKESSRTNRSTFF